MYGYQIVQEITERSGGAIVTEEGSLYPVLLDSVILGDRYRNQTSAAAVCRS